MKKIKEKFNKLTLFDRLLILFAVLVAFFLITVLFRKSSYLTVTVQVGENNVLYEPRRYGESNLAWFAEFFHEGMKEIDGLGNVSAEVLSVNSYDTYPKTKSIYLTVKLKTVYTKSSNQFTYKGSVVSIGSIIKLNLDNLLVEGIVTNTEGAESTRKNTRILVDVKIEGESLVDLETTGVEDFVATAYSIGDEIKDGEGNVAVKIVDKKVENAKRIVTTDSGEIVVRRHPLRYDVYLKLEVVAAQSDGRYYIFNDFPILIGEKIPLNTPKIATTPVITGIEIVK